MENVIKLKPKREYYRADDLMEIFGIARSTVDSWAHQEILTPIKIGRCVFYSVDEVNRLRGVIQWQVLGKKNGQRKTV